MYVKRPFTRISQLLFPVVTERLGFHALFVDISCTYEYLRDHICVKYRFLSYSRTDLYVFWYNGCHPEFPASGFISKFSQHHHLIHWSRKTWVRNILPKNLIYIYIYLYIIYIYIYIYTGAEWYLILRQEVSEERLRVMREEDWVKRYERNERRERRHECWPVFRDLYEGEPCIIDSFIYLEHWSNSRIRVMWWNFGVLLAARTSQLRTSWRRLVWVADGLSRRELQQSVNERSCNSTGSSLINSITKTS